MGNNFFALLNWLFGGNYTNISDDASFANAASFDGAASFNVGVVNNLPADKSASWIAIALSFISFAVFSISLVRRIRAHKAANNAAQEKSASPPLPRFLKISSMQGERAKVAVVGMPQLELPASSMNNGFQPIVDGVLQSVTPDPEDPPTPSVILPEQYIAATLTPRPPKRRESPVSFNENWRTSIDGFDLPRLASSTGSSSPELSPERPQASSPKRTVSAFKPPSPCFGSISSDAVVRLEPRSTGITNTPT